MTRACKCEQKRTSRRASRSDAIGIFVALALLLVLVSAAAPARAQDMSETERRVAARAAYGEGLSLQEQGKYAEALARFQAAQRFLDAPTHAVHIAECQSATGMLVEAVETYEGVLHKNLGDSPPEAFTQAQAQARVELETIRARTPTLRISVTPEPSKLKNLSVTVGKRVMPYDLVGIARPLNPGSYRVHAVADGYTLAAPVDVTLAEGEVKAIQLVMQPNLSGDRWESSAGDPNTTPPEDSKPAVPARRGFQMAMRAGYALPMGQADGETSAPIGGATGTRQTDDLSRLFSGQGALLVEVGEKLGDYIFLGGFAGLGLGAGGSDLDTVCAGRSACSSTSFATSLRLGVEIQFHILPKGTFNPWVGYGLGVERTSLSVTGPGGDASISLLGPEFGHLMAGLDVRLSKTIGLGPVLDASIAQYSSITTKQNGAEVSAATGAIGQKAIHSWFSIGTRVVIFP
jgi:hypothetical protein